MSDLEFSVPPDTEEILTERAADLTIPEDAPDTFLVRSEDNVFVVKRWS